MAKFSMKKGGKEVGSAEVYAEPHTMKGGTVSMKDVSKRDFSNKKGAYETTAKDPARTVSAGYYDKENINGEVTMRGYGAATKGIKCRGPMA